MTTILIPCKDLNLGKSRLSPWVDGRTRRSLCKMFLNRTLALATATVAASEVRLLTSDPDAREIAREFGVPTIADKGWDLNSALSGARAAMASDVSVSEVVILPIDLPCANSHSLGTVMREPGDVVIVPDHERRGTNVLSLSRAALRDFSFQYGSNSFMAHMAAAQRIGIEPAVVLDEDLAFDVDEPDDYHLWKEHAPTLLRGAAWV
ncbi:2-phospho-L-lactate guanylyltransferase [Afipia massiliensis]|uniref:2-phospho-L-lactate guanylyltransferase n=1 Tax=Afipia massiliensis TaxID=211460 RepID=A0A840N9I2_9BRAD|nr:2-phospho-L-lactate guanylyltransferase [Afipia massiliensis]MBB5055204.1 2-phospho-L-lactate guanylyltransferase [Afipia massiliensis]